MGIEDWQGVQLRDPAFLLEGSRAKALATAMPWASFSLLGASCFPSSMSSKGENPVHFWTCDGGAIGVAPFLKASYLDYRRGFNAERGFVTGSQSCSS
jgi:hypothetical protein